MSDIPLRTFGRSRNTKSGYAPLNTEQDEYDVNDNGSVNGNNRQPMPLQTVTKAAVSAANRRWKGKQKQSFQDDPEEHEGLLGDGEGRDSEDEVGRAGPARPSPQEVRPISCITQFHLTSNSDRLRGRALTGSNRVVPKTRQELYRSDRQVCFGDNAVRRTPHPSSRKVSITIHS